MLEQYNSYIKDVTSGKDIFCKYVRLAVERQLKDLKRQKTADFPYYFDEEEAARWIGFISILRHTSGEWKGQPFNIQDFQAFRWACIFGWRRVDNGARRFRRAYVEVARKQGKTEEAAAIGMGGLFIDAEPSAQVFSAATTRQQAKIVFNAAKLMFRELKKDSEYIDGISKQLAHRLLNTGSDSFFEALSSDAWTLDGLSPHIAIIDEFHAHPTADVLKVLETGAGARRSPLTYIITTAGFNIESPCFHLRRNAIDILKGLKNDETFFSAIYTLDDGDDWNDEKNWVKANPQIGVTPSWDFMRAEYTKALNEGGHSEVEFKTKNLNMWVSAAETWVQDEVWQRCPSEINENELIGRPCYAGIDFASTSDFTAICLLFPPENEGDPYIFKWYFWMPEETMKIRGRDFPDLLKYVVEKVRNAEGRLVSPSIEDATAQRCIFLTPGDSTDYEYLIQQMHVISSRYDVLAVGFDPHNAWQTVIRLTEDGFPMEKFSQGITNMSAPSKDFELIIRRKEMNHGGNPVARWMLSNVNPYYDANDNLKIKKASKWQKIDGIIAAVIALGVYNSKPRETAYSKIDAFMI